MWFCQGNFWNQWIVHDSLLRGIINMGVACEVSSILSRSDPAIAPSVGGSQLAVTVAQDIVPLSPEHNLLVGFHFGTAINFSQHAAIVSPGLQPINHDDLVECWWYKGDVDFATCGAVRIARCADYTVAILEQPNSAPEDFRADAYNAYHELLGAVQAKEHGHLVKIWNYFSGINESEGDAEKYRQFSLGRASAFDELGIHDESVPTGTAIGCLHDCGLSIIALLTNNDFRSTENPRQLSAYHYPRQYGPRSPKFSRGGRVLSADHDLFVISGTAAIIGHESVFPYETARQASETLNNLDHLADALSGLGSEDQSLVLDQQLILRVYLREREDMDLVARQLQDVFGDIEPNLVFLNADICRRELMVEIDGVKVIARP